MTAWNELVLSTDIIPISTITATGDLIVGTGNGTVGKLAIGTSGYLLYVNGTTPGWKDPTTLAVGLHATTHKSGGTDVIKLNELAVPTASVAFNGQQITDVLLHTVADATAMNALTPLVGKIVWRTDTLHPYICTSAA